MKSSEKSEKMMLPGVSEAKSPFQEMIFFLIRNSMSNKPARKTMKPETTEAE
ncbi:MAG: hypothetical protein QXK18_06465 [Candidatus Bathyarchaeia archaeon]